MFRDLSSRERKSWEESKWSKKKRNKTHKGSLNFDEFALGRELSGKGRVTVEGVKRTNAVRWNDASRDTRTHVIIILRHDRLRAPLVDEVGEKRRNTDWRNTRVS